MKTVQIAISDFAVPAPRTGSIETYSGYGALPRVGTELHLMIQAERHQKNPYYQSEKWVTHTFTKDDFKITVAGRMDGFIPGDPARIEEIKSAYNTQELARALERNPEHPYKLQVLLYAYIHTLHTGQAVEPVLHLVSSRTREAFDVPVEMEMKSFGEWLERRLDEVIQEEVEFEKLRHRRKKLSVDFQFPFENAREGQIELMETVAQTLNTKTSLLIQAPTGLGKTAGVLFPALKEALARGQKVIYITPKNSQHAVAEDAVERLQKTGSKVRSLTIHAKAKMCFKEQVVCNPEYCQYARDYYKKVSDGKLVQKLAKKKRLTFKSFQKFGLEHEVCPFEIQLDSISRADVVICDYNYVFSPRNSLTRLTANGFEKKSLPNLVIDEAHNLPSRACDYFSAELNAEVLRELQMGFGHLPTPLSAQADRLVEDAIYYIEASAGPNAHRPTKVELDVESFIGLAARTGELIAHYLESPAHLQINDKVLAFGNLCSSFAQALESLGEDFFCTFTPSRMGGKLKVVCCDASRALNEGYAEFANVVAFSATVKPFDYYSKLLGFADRPLKTAEFHSPFPRERRKLLIIPQVSTKYSDREANYGKIRSGIERILETRPGNYFVFFPSFEFLNRVAAGLNLPGFEIRAQQRQMKRADIDAYIAALNRPEQPTVILAVQGGVFAEGVDYPGEMLIGAIVVGPALPSFDFEREQLRAYYEKKHGGENGFDYAYTYPAMAKVIQSAGRVIRSHDDRGLIVLMDRRFVQSSYVKSMPSDWVGDDPYSAVSSQLLSDIKRFWEENGS